MGRCQYHGQCVQETDKVGGERGTEMRPQAGDANYGGEFDVEGEKMREVEGAESVKSEPLTEKAVSGFCLSSPGSTLQPVNRVACKKVKNHPDRV